VIGQARRLPDEARQPPSCCRGFRGGRHASTLVAPRPLLARRRWR
jgi:hypothetical protein